MNVAVNGTNFAILRNDRETVNFYKTETYEKLSLNYKECGTRTGICSGSVDRIVTVKESCLI